MNSEALIQLRRVESETQERNRVRRLPDHAVIVNTQDLRRWNSMARTMNFPQTLNNVCLAKLDKKGSHSIKIVEDHGDTLTAQVFMKFYGQDYPEDALLTLRTRDYNEFAHGALKLK